MTIEPAMFGRDINRLKGFAMPATDDEDELVRCAQEEANNPPEDAHGLNAMLGWLAPPELMPEAAESRPPGYKLFSPGAIGLVAFLTGPLAAFILLTVNYRRLGKRGAAKVTIAIGLVTMVALAVIIIDVPKSFPILLIGLPLFLAIWLAAGALQGNSYYSHLERGGSPASGWSVAGFGILGLVLSFGIVLGIVLPWEPYFSEGFGQRIDYDGGNELYYTKGVTETDARTLGAFLCESGFFNGRHPKSVQISRDGKLLVISFIVRKSALNDQEVQQGFRAIGQRASQHAFGGRPVVVNLCDEEFNAMKRLRAAE